MRVNKETVTAYTLELTEQEARELIDEIEANADCDHLNPDEDPQLLEMLHRLQTAFLPGGNTAGDSNIYIHGPSGHPYRFSGWGRQDNNTKDETTRHYTK